MFDSAVRREPPLLEGTLRPRAPGRADRRARSRASSTSARPLRTVSSSSRSTEPLRDAISALGPVAYRRAAFNVSAMATWLDPADDARHIEWARADGGGDRAVVSRRWIRQLHAGRRADRARPRRVRRRGVRAAAGAEVSVRPGERPAPKPEHPAALANDLGQPGCEPRRRPSRGRFSGCGLRVPRTTVRRAVAGGMPKRSRSPWTTSTGTGTASSSGRRLGDASPERRGGGCNGNARHTTPTAPVSDAVRHATRAPAERPPTTSGSPRSSVVRGGGRRPSSTRCRAGAREPAIDVLRRDRAAPRGRRDEPLRERRLRDRDEVAGADSAPGAMSQDEGASSVARRVHVRSREPVGSLDVDGPHAVMLPAGHSAPAQT